MKKVRWIIQDNLIAENDRKQFQKACDDLGVEHHEVIVIPFSEELPEFPIDDEYENVYYGSTTFMNNIYEQLDAPVGLFYDHETFSMKNYIDKWGEHMLSKEAEFMTVQEFIDDKSGWDPCNWFMRPDGDGKQFDGVVALEGELREMLVKATSVDGGPITGDMKILIAPAYNIHREWRNYAVNGKIISSSRYRKNFRLSKSAEDIPEDMIKYAEDRLAEYSPHDIVAIDIAEVKEDGEYKYFIIECGCMNSVGFYYADINKYVESITGYMEDKQKKVESL